MIKMIKMIKWWIRYRFKARNARLRLKGYRYALTGSGAAHCRRLHKIGCYNLLPKKGIVKPVYFRTAQDAERWSDRDLLDCQACGGSDGEYF